MNNLPLQSVGTKRIKGIRPTDYSQRSRIYCGCGGCKNGSRYCSCVAENYTCIEPFSGTTVFRAFDDDFGLPGSDWGIDPGPICYFDGFTTLSEWTEPCGLLPPIAPVGPVSIR